MTSIKARLNRTRIGKDGMHPLAIQVIRGRIKREIYTLFRLYQDEFDPVTEQAIVGQCKNRDSYIKEANEHLIYAKELLRQTVSFLSQKGDYTVYELVDAYKQRSEKNDFFIYGEQKSNELIATNKNSTASNYRSAINSFARFKGNRELLLSEITKKMAEDFLNFLAGKNRSINTQNFYLKQLCSIYNHASADGYCHPGNNPFSKIKLQKCETEKRGISKFIIKRLRDLCLEGKHPDLALADNIFLFSFYTRGMSFIDMCYLKKENITDNTLTYKRRKTGQKLQIKIEPALKALLDLYADENSPYLLPMLRNGDSHADYKYVQRRLNKRIRQIGEMLKCESPLTFYVARHSWATLAHKRGIPVSVISESLGHTSERTTLIYLKALDNKTLDQANRRVINCCFNGKTQ